jgi:energy-coupling factor transporter ATP-binding protein EcfA2
MPRLTKSDIVQRLLSGKAIPWTDPDSKSTSIKLDTAKQRRLLSFLLKSKVREVKGLPADFTDELAAAFAAAGDPAADSALDTEASLRGGPWKVEAVRIEGFGGVNAWNGKPLDLRFDGESLLIEGPNGSGKSSLTAAIIWGLTGERPRDQDKGACDEARPVYGADDREAGRWPPVATYPADVRDLTLQPSVNVEITFSDPSGALAVAKRSFDGNETKVSIDPTLSIPSILLEAGLLMPARLPHLRLDEGRGRITDAVQKLTGLDDLIDLGTFIQGLCHKSRDYRSFKTAEVTAAKLAFDSALETARSILAPISITVPNFSPSDTDSPAGGMATLGKQLNDKASDLTRIVSGDLRVGLDLANPQVQRQINLELAGAEQDVNDGLEALPIWKTLRTVHSALDPTSRIKLREAIVAGQQALREALGFFDKDQSDHRFGPVAEVVGIGLA